MPGRFALIVAADKFSDEKLNQLRAPSSDAESLGAVLADPSIGGFEVESLINRPAQQVREDVERFFRSREPEDLLLLYFACHGVKDRRGRLYMAMSDTRLDLLASRGVAAQFVNEQLESCRSRRIVLMLDCCYSGAYAKNFVPRGSSNANVLESFDGQGRVIITASDALEYAFEDDELTKSDIRSSIFTGAVIRGLQTGDADLDQDGRVSVDDLYKFTYREVRTRTPNQTPGRVDQVSGNIYLAANPRISAPPVSSNADPFDLAVSERRWEREDASLELRKLTQDADEAIAQAAQKALEKLADDHERLVRASAMAALGDVTRSHYERGLVLAGNGDLPGAEAEFAKVSDSANSTPEIAACTHFNRGVLAAASQDTETAYQQYSAALESGVPKAASRAALNLGCLHDAANREDQAIAMYQTALSYDNAEVTPRAAFLLGLKYEKRGDPSKAWFYFARSADYGNQPFALEATSRYKRLLPAASGEDILIRILTLSGYPDPASTALLWLVKYFEGDSRSTHAYRRLAETGDAESAAQAQEALSKAKEAKRRERMRKLVKLRPGK